MRQKTKTEKAIEDWTGLEAFERSITRLEEELTEFPSRATDLAEALVPGGSVESTKASLLVSGLAALPACRANKTPPPSDWIFRPGEGSNQEALTAASERAMRAALASGAPGEDVCAWTMESLGRLTTISGRFNVAFGNTLSLWSVAVAMDRNPELAAALKATVPPGASFQEVEAYLNKDLYPRLARLLEEEGTSLAPYLASKTGVNLRQLGQAFGMVGPKPDLSGRVMPHVVETSFLRGMRDVRDYCVLATGARKAQVTNQGQVKDAGYMTRKISLLIIDTDLDRETEDCGSRHYVKVTPKNAGVAARLSGRLYATPDGSLREFPSSAEGLAETVGKEFLLRSPVTCASQKGACAACYGPRLHVLNSDLHAGILAMTILTSQLTQQLLSSKHLLQTSSKEIAWPENLSEWATGGRNGLRVVQGRDRRVLLRQEFVEDSDSGERVIRRVGFSDKKREEWFDLPVAAVLTEETEELMAEWNDPQTGGSVIPANEWASRKRGFSNRSDDDEGEDVGQVDDGPRPFLLVQTENREISASLKAVKDLIETKDHLGIPDYHGILQEILHRLEESGITIQSCHVEMILRAMVRDVQDSTRRPDFSKKKEPAYEVLRVADAVMASPSAAVSLSFEQLDRQLRDPATFVKDGKSLLDALFE